MNNFSFVIQADENSALELQLGRFIPTAATSAAASAAAAAASVAAIGSGASPDAGTLTGPEVLPLSRGAGLLQTTLTKVAQWILQTFAGLPKTPIQFGAKGDGATDDTAAFTSLEASYAGKVIDLQGRTYVVAAIPTKNAYHNGVFSVSGGATNQALLGKTFATSRARFHAFGGQLVSLHKSLCNPLEQQTTIAFIGDSITWGLQLAENAISTPRNGTLADQRDNYASESWVNQFKRYIGATYFDNTAPVQSNWSYSSGGQSTATFSRTEQLYTAYQPFTVATSSATNVETKDSGALLGYRHTLGINPTGSTASISFPFTGTAFNLVFTSISAADSADYEVVVNGVSQGTFSSFTTGSTYQQRRTHTFGYVRNKTIQINVKYAAANTSVAHLNFEAIEVIKQCSILNQGVIGTTAYQYNYYNFGQNGFGPTVVTSDLNYVFVQLGTNDRASTMTSYSIANGINSFKKWMNALLANVTPTASVILMNSNPASADSKPTYSFDMQDVRNMVHQLGSDNSLDVIDNYSIFSGLDNSVYTADGLHPNLLGHTMYARNIIGALEASAAGVTAFTQRPTFAGATPWDSANLNFATPPAIGATTPSTGKFTTLQATSTITPSSTAGIVGTATNDNANAGSVGEFISSTVLIGSAVALTNATTANVTSISLTAGDWDVTGNVWTNPAGSTTQSLFAAAISTTSATFPTAPASGGSIQLPYAAATGTAIGGPVGRTRLSLSGTTTVFLVVNVNFAASTNSAFGFIGARRVR
jgi:lysophospholipase L1-like esterase